MAESKTELLPWEARLAAALPGGKEDLVYLRTSFGAMKQAGWKDRESAKNPRSDYAYYTPEGERKRILALPIEEGREYFETREAFLTYVIKHMTAYYEAKEKGSERRLKELVTPVPTNASACVIMAGASKLDKSNNKMMWPARLATPEEALAYRREHNVGEERVVVVFFALGGHHTLTCIKRDFCRRVTLEELDYMMDLWFNGGAELQAGVTLGRPLKDAQLGLEFVAALAYAQAFAHLGADNLSVERPVRNEACVTVFNAEQLDNPWAFGSRTSSMVSEDDAGISEKGEVGLEFAHEYPGLRPCNRCAAAGESCDAPETVATALHYLQTRGDYTFPSPLTLQYGASRVGLGGGGKRKSSDPVPTLGGPSSCSSNSSSSSSSSSAGSSLDDSGGGAAASLGKQTEGNKRAKKYRDGNGQTASFPFSTLASPSTSRPAQHKDKKERRASSGPPRALPSLVLSPPRRPPLPQVEEPKDLSAAVLAFQQAWDTLLSQAASLAAPSPANWQHAPLSVKAVEAVVVPQLIARCEAGQLDVAGDLTLAHRLVMSAMEEVQALGAQVGKERRQEVAHLEAEFRGAVVKLGVKADGALAALDGGMEPRDVLALLLAQYEQDERELEKNKGEGVEGGSRKAGGGGGAGADSSMDTGQARMVAAALAADLEKVRNLLPSLSSAPGLVILHETISKYEQRLQETAAACDKPPPASNGEIGVEGGGEGLMMTTTTTPPPPTTTVSGSAGSSSSSEQQSARIAEQFQPLIQRLENAASLASASAAQLDDAARMTLVQWGAFRRQLLRKRTEGNEAASKTLLLYDVRCAHHKVPEAHVEQPQRFLHASEAMRQLAREHSQVFVLRTEIGAQYFPLWRGPREGYTEEILRVHTAAHLEGIRTRCDSAGSELTRLSAPRVTAAAAAAATAGVQAWLARQTAGSSSSSSTSSSSGGQGSSNATGSSSRPLLRSTAAGSSSLSSILGAGLGEGAPGHLYHQPFLIPHSPRGGGGGGGYGGGASGGSGGGGPSSKKKEEVDGDTFGNRESFVAASVGFAGTLQAVDAVLQAHARNAFVACRPPGHHAGRNGKPALDPGADERARDVGWGFCFLNYVAGAALHAVQKWGLSRVTVVDIDLHHGNGTEEILTMHRNPAFQFISVHVAGMFPFTGEADRACWPHLVNIAIQAPLTPSKYRKVWGKIDEAVDAFAPELILMSAGFDAHINDPLGSKAFVGGGKYRLAPIGRLSSDDFFDVVSRVVNLANRHCMGRLVAVMEGGYCCRPPAASSSSSAASASASRARSKGEEEEEGDSSDNDVTDPSAVEKETIRDCVAATCRALGGVERKGEGRE